MPPIHPAGTSPDPAFSSNPSGAGLSSENPVEHRSPERNGYTSTETSVAASHGDRLNAPVPVRETQPRKGLSGGVWLVLLILAILLAAAIVFGILRRSHAADQLEHASVESAIPTVNVIYPAGGHLATELTLPGAVQAFTDTPIYSRTNGYLKQWFFDIGAHVRRGQLMATIETPEVDQQLQVAEADLKSAQANLNLAKTTAARYQALLKSNSVSKQETDEATSGELSKDAAVEAAEAQVRRLQQLQSFEKIYAPFDGIVTARNTDVGALIVAGQEGTGNGQNQRELFHLAAIGRVRVFVSVPEADTASIHDGASVTLTSDAYPGRIFDGIVARNANAVDPSTRTLNVEVDVPNQKADLLPGAYVFVHFKLPSTGNTLTIPSNTLIFRSQGLRVGVVRQEGGKDRVELVPVTISHDGGALVEISSGLTTTDQVITDPSDSLTTGQQVKVGRPGSRLERTPGSDTVMRTLVKSTVLFALIGLTGCMVGPKYVKPIVPTYQAPSAYTDSYKETDVNWHPAGPADTSLRGTWWDIFHDQTLSLLEVKAGIQNQSLQAAAARYTEARAQIGINNAARYPTIGTDPFAGGLRDSATRPYFNPALANNGVGDIQLPLTLSYEVDLFGRIRRTINEAREEAQASAADLQNVQLSIQSDLAVDYFELRSADATRQLLSDTVKDYEEALRITTNRFKGGVVAESDVFQAQTQLQDAIVQRDDSTVRRAQYEHAIAVLIGQPPASFSIAEDPTPPVPPYIPTGLPSQLLERRPDIAAAERRTAEANERIGIARAAYFPTLNLAASAGFESNALAGFFNASNIVYALGPTLSQTFYDGGRRRGVSDQALAGFTEYSADYRQTVLTAFQQVEDNLAVLRILSVESTNQQKATQAARGAQQIFNNRYVGGIDTYLQVVTAQQTALFNERNDIDILRRRMDASVLLVKALGGGWSTANLPRN